MHFLKYLFICLSCITSYSHATHSYYYIKHKLHPQKRALLLADAHTQGNTQQAMLDELEILHLLHEFQQMMHRHQLSFPVTCIAEDNETVYNKGVAATFRPIREILKKGDFPLRVIHAEERSTAGFNVNIFLRTLIANSQTNPQHINLFTALDNPNVGDNVEMLLNFKPTDFVRDYWQHLDSKQQEYTQLQNIYKGNATIAPVLNELHQKFYRMQEQFYEYFGELRDSKFEPAILKLIQKQKKLDEKFELFERLANLILGLNYTITEIGFLKAFLATQQASDSKAIGIFGFMHIRNLLPYLQRLDYEVVEMESLPMHELPASKKFFKNISNFPIFMRSQQDSHSVLKGKTTRLLTQLLAVDATPIQEAADSSNEFKAFIRQFQDLSFFERYASFMQKKCASCGKQAEAQHKLLRCSHCNTTYYCNATCQRNDWPNHKNIVFK